MEGGIFEARSDYGTALSSAGVSASEEWSSKKASVGGSCGEDGISKMMEALPPALSWMMNSEEASSLVFKKLYSAKETVFGTYGKLCVRLENMRYEDVEEDSSPKRSIRRTEGFERKSMGFGKTFK